MDTNIWEETAASILPWRMEAPGKDKEFNFFFLLQGKAIEYFGFSDHSRTSRPLDLFRC
jgi:hypothetical protein